MEASRDSFIPNFAVNVQIVEIHTVGIRRKCAFFRQADSFGLRLQNYTISATWQNKFSQYEEKVYFCGL